MPYARERIYNDGGIALQHDQDIGVHLVNELGPDQEFKRVPVEVDFDSRLVNWMHNAWRNKREVLERNRDAIRRTCGLRMVEFDIMVVG